MEMGNGTCEMRILEAKTSIPSCGCIARTNSIEGESRLYRRNNIFLCLQCGPPIALKRAERVFPK